MAAYAKLNLPRIDRSLKSSNVVVDGLYSWEEYIFLKEYYGKQFTTVAVWASPATRHARLARRANRPLTLEEAASRDKSEIENSNKGGPIAMADFTIVNEDSLGGSLTQHLGWRSIFFLSALLGLAVIGVVLWKLKGEWTGAKGERFDFVGSVIYILGLVALVYGFTLLPAMSGVGLIIGGAIGLAAFTKWEMRTRSPVLDINLFRNSKAFAFSNLAALINYSATFAVSFLMSLYLQYLKGFSPESAGLILVAMPAMQAVFSPLAGRFSDRIQPRIIASTGMTLTTIGLIIFIFLSEETPVGLIIGNLLLMGFGFALFSSPNTNAVMSSAPKTAYGVASATLATMRQVGMVLSMGVAMLMFTLYMGRVQITPEYYPLFLQSMKTAFIIFAVLCFGGIFASLARGNVR